MKRTNSLTVLLVAGSLLAFGASGCKKKLQNVTPLPGSRAGEVGGPGPARPIDTASLPPIDTGPRTVPIDPTQSPTGGIPFDPNIDRSNWREDPDTFHADTVYFDFDKSSIKPSEVSKIRAVADRFKTMSAKALRIDGHCDERGTEEYNRSLGERRALSIREALVREGVAANLIDTRTYGEEHPADAGRDETAWARNRRGEFILLSPP
jgi:peptidoglycan-associated lipoprotein